MFENWGCGLYTSAAYTQAFMAIVSYTVHTCYKFKWLVIVIVIFFPAAPHKFYIGFRYVNPLTEDTIDQMERQVDST